MSELPLVAVAMSGGVDSSVAAALLVEQGYPVIGLMLRLWSEPGREGDNKCCTPDSVSQARRVAGRLGIPFYVIDSREFFRKVVVEEFLSGYGNGATPNPCMVCNQKVRWGFLLDKAKALGASFLATGHYARIHKCSNEKFQLLRAVDESKDQSYVLSRLKQEQLASTRLPLGEYHKTDVRELARKYQFEVADRPDSQDLCFLGGKDYREFLVRQVPGVNIPGQIISRSGTVLGQHKGLAFYTIGQRKGLGIANKRPLYVLNKNVLRNQLVVGFIEELVFNKLVASEANWIIGESPVEPFCGQIKIRYTAHLSSGTVYPLPENQFQIVFEYPLRDITPGQMAVIYNSDVVVGSGVIQTAE